MAYISNINVIDKEKIEIGIIENWLDAISE